LKYIKIFLKNILFLILVYTNNLIKKINSKLKKYNIIELQHHARPKITSKAQVTGPHIQIRQDKAYTFTALGWIRNLIQWPVFTTKDKASNLH